MTGLRRPGGCWGSRELGSVGTVGRGTCSVVAGVRFTVAGVAGLRNKCSAIKKGAAERIVCRTWEVLCGGAALAIRLWQGFTACSGRRHWCVGKASWSVKAHTCARRGCVGNKLRLA